MSRRHATGVRVVVWCGALCALAVVLAACASTPSTGGHASPRPSQRSSGGGTVGPATAIRPSSAVLSPDGTKIAAAGVKGISVWSAADGSLEHTFGSGHVLAWSPDGTMLAVDAPTSAGAGTGVRLLRAGDGSLVRAVDGHHDGGPREAPSAIRALAFSPDGATVASAGYDGTVRLWSVSDGAQRAVLHSHLRAPSSIAFSRSGRIAVAGAGGPVEIWDAVNHRQVGTLAGVQARFVRYTPDGRRLVTTAAVPGSKAGEGLRVWNAETLRLVRADPGQVDPTSLVLDRAGRLAAFTTVGSGAVQVWPLAGGRTSTFPGLAPQGTVVAFFPVAARVYTATGTSLTGWNIATGKVAIRFRLP